MHTTAVSPLLQMLLAMVVLGLANNHVASFRRWRRISSWVLVTTRLLTMVEVARRVR